MRPVYAGLFLLLFVLTTGGCKRSRPGITVGQAYQELKDTLVLPVKDTPVYKKGYRPPVGVKYTEKRDRKVAPRRLEIGKALQNVKDLKLSDMAKRLTYVRLPAERITDIFPVPGGYMITAVDGVYRSASDFSGLRKVYRNDIEKKKDPVFGMMYSLRSGLDRLSYDKSSGKVQGIFEDNDLEQWKFSSYLTSIPLERLGKDTVWTQDSVTLRMPVHIRRFFAAAGTFFVGGEKSKQGILYDRLLSFNLQGDTLCRFRLGVDTYPEMKGTYRNADPDISYSYDSRFRFRPAYCDTVYEVVDECTLRPVWVMDFGEYRVSAKEGLPISVNLAGKYLVYDLRESPERLFVQITENYSCRNNEETGVVHYYWLVYEKNSGAFFSLPLKETRPIQKGIPDDLHGGNMFWPDFIVGKKMMMKTTGKELRKILNERHPEWGRIEDEEVILVIAE